MYRVCHWNRLQAVWHVRPIMQASLQVEMKMYLTKKELSKSSKPRGHSTIVLYCIVLSSMKSYMPTSVLISVLAGADQGGHRAASQPVQLCLLSVHFLGARWPHRGPSYGQPRHALPSHPRLPVHCPLWPMQGEEKKHPLVLGSVMLSMRGLSLPLVLEV